MLFDCIFFFVFIVVVKICDYYSDMGAVRTFSDFFCESIIRISSYRHIVCVTRSIATCDYRFDTIFFDTMGFFFRIMNTYFVHDVVGVASATI